MEIPKFPEKTVGLKCPCCGTVGMTNFSTERVYDSHDTCNVVKLRCSHCGYYIEIDDNSQRWSSDEQKMANTLIAEWEQKTPPVLHPCKLCGKKPSLTYYSWVSKIQCRDCGVAVSGGRIEKAVDVWNNLMPAPAQKEEESPLPLIDDEDWDSCYTTSEDIAEMYRGMTAIVWGSVALLAFVGLLVWGAIKLFS